MGSDTVFLVGGAVRDWLLGRRPREYDFAFTESPDLFLQRNPRAHKVGRSVSVYLLDGSEYMPLRGADSDGLSLAERIALDLAGRDLTINALALSPDGVLYAHPAALDDLREGILRPASPTSFHDDPARIFRLASLACRLPDFSPAPEALCAMRDVSRAGLTAALPAERVGRECLKAFGAEKPSRWLDILAAGDSLAPWFAELAESAAIPAGPTPYHAESLLEHTMAVMDAVAGDPLRVWMAFCHDLGKALTEAHVLPHHYGHERSGAGLAALLGERLSLPARYREAGSLSAELHMKGGLYASLRPGTRCDLLLKVHSARLDDAFWRLVEADSGRRLRDRAARELAAILAVALPKEWRGRGEEAGRWLREERCRVLAAQSKDLE